MLSVAILKRFQVVKEGLLLLGRVRQVLETKVNVALPCRMNGVVMACHISEAYNKILEAYVNDQVIIFIIILCHIIQVNSFRFDL